MRRIVSFILLLTSTAGAAGLSDSEKLDRIKEQIEERRKIRAHALAAAGRAFSPIPNADSWFKEEMDLTIKNEAIGLCAQTFATLAKKEVFVSIRVMKREISISAGRVDGEKALAAFRNAIEAQGIQIVPVGTTILVLVEPIEGTTEKKS
jgi:hypothetical protein